MIYSGFFHFVWKFSKNQIRLKIAVTEDKVEKIDTGFLILVGYKLLLIRINPLFPDNKHCNGKLCFASKRLATLSNPGSILKTFYNLQQLVSTEDKIQNKIYL